jgi:hypothetical protein
LSTDPKKVRLKVYDEIKRMFKSRISCCFSTGTLQGDECSRTGLCQYHPTAQLHHGSLKKAVGDFVTPFVLEKLFDYSCSVELAGSYMGMSLANSGNFV